MKRFDLVILSVALLLLLNGCFMLDKELAEAVRSGDPSNCKSLVDDDGNPQQSRIDSCYRQIAVNKEDSSICNMIDSSYDTDRCHSEIAIKKNDETLCKAAGEEQSNCYKEIAIAKKDHLICREINEEGYYRDSCFESVAIESKDDKICAEIEEEQYQQSCYAHYAAQVGDAWTCEKLNTQNSKDACYSDVAETTGDIRVCDKIEGRKGNLFQTCVYGVAKKTGDASVCARLEDESTLSSEDEIDDCYYGAGYYNNKASACSAIKDEVRRDKCLVHVATENADTDICDERIDRTDYKDECYKQIAWKQDHPRYCEEIKDAAVKAECMRRFE